LWHKDAVVLALQRDVRIQSEYDIDALATKVVADVLYGLVELRDDHAVRILT